MVELKRCPFCGGEAENRRTVEKIDGGAYCDAVSVRCMKCGARSEFVFYDAHKHPNGEEYEEAAETWNNRGADLRTATPNYEAECDRLRQELDKAMAEADYLRTEMKLAESECARLRAQMDIVYLIFRGRN